MSGTPADPRESLAAVIAAFRERLPTRVRELTNALARARGGEATATAEARSLAHRLAGTAGSYGHVEAGCHAAAIEEQLGGDTPDWGAVEAALAALTASAARP